jgi:hypothetical protein
MRCSVRLVSAQRFPNRVRRQIASRAARRRALPDNVRSIVEPTDQPYCTALGMISTVAPAGTLVPAAGT